MMKVSDYIAKFIKTQKVDTVFGYQGGAITHIVNSLYETEGVRYISLYHEQGAAFAAEGYSRRSENIGVAVATSGPGATNLITGIGSCYFDSIACVFITGQVNLNEYKRNNKIRQEGFQETDIVEIVKSITKYAVMIKKPEDIRYHLEKAFFLAKYERKGPVLIDIPMNIQKAEVDEKTLKGFDFLEEYKVLKENDIKKDIEEVINLLEQSNRPIIIAGGGVRGAGANDELDRFVALSKIPVVSTLMGLDSFNNFNEEFVGFMGSYGVRAANLAVANSDLILVIGSRLTTRQTSPVVKSFAREAKIIHVDIDENELNIKVNEHLSVRCDIKEFLNKLIDKYIEENINLDINKWKDKINEYKVQYPTYPTQKIGKNIDPNEAMHVLSEFLNENTVVTLDVGQNQVWAAQSLKVGKNQRILASGGMGAMGFSIPAAIGAYYADKNSKIIAIVGDGGFQMNIQELQTIIRENIPIKIILMNNKSLGMIRHFQELYFNSKYYGTIDGYDTPNFIKICNAYGLNCHSIKKTRDLNQIKDYIDDCENQFIEIILSKTTYVVPKLEMGNPIEDQSPLVPRDEFIKNMIIKPYEK